MFEFSPESGLWGLFASAFISATLLPGSSEIVLVGLLTKYPELLWTAIAVATVGNTCGGVTSYWLGRLFPNKAEGKAIEWLKKYGMWSLLFSWVPLFGDVLVRVSPSYRLALHLDTDEANAADVQTGAQATVEGIQSQAS
jgi:membrane protein YqaA with SNARE-associated domain